MIIAIDGTSTDLSVALAEPDGTPLEEVAWSSTQRQSGELLPRLQTAVDRSGRSLGSATALAVGTGPGSFTGLRVAMAIAKGLAFALHLPIIGVPSLPAWLDAAPGASAAAVRAGAREAYVLVRGETAPLIADGERLAGRLAGAVVVAPTELATAFGLDSVITPRGAGAMARSAAERLTRSGAGDDLRRLEPIYLRAPRGVAIENEAQVRWL